MHRFFVSPSCIAGETVTITGRQAFQMRKVLRLAAGDRIVVLDDSGAEYEVALTDVKARRVAGSVVERRWCANEPGVRITLYQALLKGTRIEMVLQKCTEIGVAGFVLMNCERCVARDPARSRWQRWERIVVEAAEQAGRGRIPSLTGVKDFPEACDDVAEIALLPWEGERHTGIRSFLGAKRRNGPSSPVSLFVGPEGGFAEGEVAHAVSRRIEPVSLGPRILRAETAGFVAATAILYEHGELEHQYSEQVVDITCLPNAK